MSVLTIKNMSPKLHRALKQRAVLHRRSLNSEILECLENEVAPKPFDPAAFLGEIRAERAQSAVTIDDDFLAKHKRSGAA
jgi:plasmid stability protein